MRRPGSMTPATWRAPSRPAGTAPKPGLRLLREIPLPGPANRFDYQSVDPARGRIYMNHMNAGRTIVFDADSGKVVTEIHGSAARDRRLGGALASSGLHLGRGRARGRDHRRSHAQGRRHASADIRFPDGIAYASDADKVFVSDESGDADVVIDAKTGAKRSTIALGGEAGNTHYDSVSHCIFVAVQTKNQMVAIDPVSEKHRPALRSPGIGSPARIHAR